MRGSTYGPRAKRTMHGEMIREPTVVAEQLTGGKNAPTY